MKELFEKVKEDISGIITNVSNDNEGSRIGEEINSLEKGAKRYMEARIYEGLAKEYNRQAQIKWDEYVKWFKGECAERMEEQQMEEQVTRQKIYDELSEILQEPRDKIKRRTTDMIKVFDRLSKLDERMIKELSMKGLKSLVRLSERNFERICKEVQGKIEAEEQQQREETPMIGSDEEIRRMIMTRYELNEITPEMIEELRQMMLEGKRQEELNIWIDENISKWARNDEREEWLGRRIEGIRDYEPMNPIFID